MFNKIGSPLLSRALIRLLAWWFLLTCSQLQVVKAAAEESPVKLDHACISFRIGVTLSLPEARFNELMALFDKYKGVTDEITFFTSATHPPLPLAVIQERAGVLAQRMKRVREKGYHTGINVLATIGHHNENLANSLQGPFTPMTDIHGQICQGSFCPNDENLREYIRQLYHSIALADPDYIWLDDDIRLAGHMPIYLTCFCDHCLSIFNQETGVTYTRQSLAKAADEGTVEEKLRLRNAWLQHNRNTLARLFELIEKTVHDLRPEMPLGFMTGDRFFEGYDFDHWAQILAGPHQTPVYWRPGGGYYQDIHTSELVGKSHDIGRQVSMLPQQVISIQSEIENFPYQRLKKAANMVVLEAGQHIAAGCTGAAFNVLSMYDEPLDEFEPLMAALLRARPFFDLLVRTLGRSPLTGVHTQWNKNTFATANLFQGSWFESTSLLPAHELWDIGLPAAYSENEAAVTLLSKTSPFSLNRDEIKTMLSRSVYMDAQALDRIEKFVDHPLNGRFVGRLRDNRQSFLGWNVPAATLAKTDSNAQTLTSLVDYSDQEVSSCAMGIFENRLGGRVCVAGYYPWTYLQNLSKSAQLKSVFRWLSRDRLLGYVDSYHKVNMWMRQIPYDHLAVVLTNASFDPAEDITLLLQTNGRKLALYDMACNRTILTLQGEEGVYKKFILPRIDPWQMRLLVTER